MTLAAVVHEFVADGAAVYGHLWSSGVGSDVHAAQMLLRCALECASQQKSDETLGEEDAVAVWTRVVLPTLIHADPVTAGLGRDLFQAVLAHFQHRIPEWFWTVIGSQLLGDLTSCVATPGHPVASEFRPPLPLECACVLLSRCVAVAADCDTAAAAFISSVCDAVLLILSTDMHTPRVCVCLNLLHTVLPHLTSPHRIGSLLGVVSGMLAIQGDRRRDAYCLLCQFCHQIPGLTHSQLFWCVRVCVYVYACVFSM